MGGDRTTRCSSMRPKAARPRPMQLKEAQGSSIQLNGMRGSSTETRSMQARSAERRKGQGVVGLVSTSDSETALQRPYLAYSIHFIHWVS